MGRCEMWYLATAEKAFIPHLSELYITGLSVALVCRLSSKLQDTTWKQPILGFQKVQRVVFQDKSETCHSVIYVANPYPQTLLRKMSAHPSLEVNTNCLETFVDALVSSLALGFHKVLLSYKVYSGSPQRNPFHSE